MSPKNPKKIGPVKIIILLIITFLVVSWIRAAIILTNLQKEVDAYSNQVQDQIKQQAITDPKQIISFVNQAETCSLLSPHSSDFSQWIVIHKYQNDPSKSDKDKQAVAKLSAKKFPEITTDSAIFIFDDSLFITRIDYQDQDHVKLLDQISPKLGQNLISCYFPDRRIPTIGHFQNRKEQEYIDAEKPKIEKSLADVNAQLEKIYQGGDPTNKDYLERRKASGEVMLGVLGKALGYQKPPDTIYLILDEKRNDNPDRYVATLVHEYMHYIGYQPNNIHERFLDDGIGDTYAIRILEKAGRVYKGSYPHALKITAEMMKDIPEENFLDFLFTNNQKKMEQAIDQAYGQGFYEQHRSLLKTAVDDNSDPGKEAAASVIEDIETARGK